MFEPTAYSEANPRQTQWVGALISAVVWIILLLGLGLLVLRVVGWRGRVRRQEKSENYMENSRMVQGLQEQRRELQARLRDLTAE